MTTVWEEHAKKWALFAPPLRPSREDLSKIEAEAEKLFKKKGSLSALLLGVTPEIALLNWPEVAQLRAIDQCPHMIRYVFPHAQMKLADFKVDQGDWRSLPFPNQSVDLVTADGSYAFMRFPDQFDDLSQEIRRVLSSEGRLVIRLFIRPEKGELPEEVLAQEIENFHLFKWRLLMAFHGDSSQGVSLGAVWDFWDRHRPNRGWDPEVIKTIDNYRGSQGRYYFPTFKEALFYFGSRFKIEEIFHPSYELGERFPTFVLS
jgi:SAM-dependent methyltransferase